MGYPEERRQAEILMGYAVMAVAALVLLGLGGVLAYVLRG